MILPFVRELVADLERSPVFERVRRHLAGGTGRRRVSGLTATARALYLPYFVRASDAPALVLVADNKAAETLHANLLAACQLTGALQADEVLRLPAHDVLPFENLSPHSEIQEQRAATLWKIASGQARLVVAPIEAACMRLFAPRSLRRARAERCVAAKSTFRRCSSSTSSRSATRGSTSSTCRARLRFAAASSTSTDRRWSARCASTSSATRSNPSAASIRRRSAQSTSIDEVLLLPLTETPATEALLEAINARLTRSGSAGAALEGGETPSELQTHVAGSARREATIFPGWEFYAPVAGARSSLLELMGPQTRVFVEEPAMVLNQGERWWNKVEQRHERSGIGSLVRAEDLYLSPWELEDRLRVFSGCDLDQLGAVDVLESTRSDASEIEFATRPTMRFHGSIPSFIDELKKLMESEARVLIAAPNQGEVERLAGLLQEYGVPYRIGWRTDQGASTTVFSESSYLAGDLRTPVLVRAAIANGVQVLDLDRATARQFVLFGANDLNDEVDVHARPVRRSEDLGLCFRSSRSCRRRLTSCMSSTASRATTGCASLTRRRMAPTARSLS